MNIAALNPQDVSSSVIAWIAILPTIVAALAGTAAIILPQIAKLKAQVESLQTAHNNLSQNTNATLNAQGQSISAASLAIVPPASILPAQYAATLQPEATTQAIEANTAATQENTAAQLAAEQPPT